jgi:hypothetical protein
MYPDSKALASTRAYRPFIVTDLLAAHSRSPARMSPARTLQKEAPPWGRSLFVRFPANPPGHYSLRFRRSMSEVR